MIATLLVDRPWLAPTAFVLLLLAGPLVGRWLVARSALAWWLTGLSLLPVGLLTLVPGDRVITERCTVQWSLPTPGRVELMANVVLFVAPALLGGVATRRPLPTLIACSMLSAVLEAVQALVPGIGRSCDTTDWLSNTIGATIGAGLGCIALRWAAVERPQGRPARRG